MWWSNKYLLLYTVDQHLLVRYLLGSFSEDSILLLFFYFFKEMHGEPDQML